MGHILVPVDFSLASINALEHAVFYANKYGYSIRLIHVKRENIEYSYVIDISSFDRALSSGIEDGLEHLIERYKSLLKGSIDYKIREGRVYTEICNQAKYGDSEFIVMGTHGVSGFEERWVGSNAFRVVNNAPCPVVTVRYNFYVQKLSKIILPIDITKETRQKVPFIATMATRFDATIYLVDVREDNRQRTKHTLKESIDNIMAYLQRRNIKIERASLYGKILPEVIIEYALMVDSDLIAIMSESIERAHNILSGPYAQQMVNHSPIPVISFPVNAY